MEKIRLGHTGRTVTRIGLGAMPLSLHGRPNREQAKAVIRRAVELGVTLIDTADVYCLDHREYGHNERLIAEAFREMGLRAGDSDGSDSSSPLVATKGGRTRPDGAWGHAARPEQLRMACEASLAALGVDRIDLYQLHAPDPDEPFLESVEALASLRDEGKVAAVGLSNVTVEQIEEAMQVLPIASVQNRFGPWDVGFRTSPVVELCTRQGITFLAYSPVGGGERAPTLGKSPGLQALGPELGATPFELTLAYLLRLSPVLVPIPGASRASSIESSVRAAGLELDVYTVRSIQKAFRALPGSKGLLDRILAKARAWSS